MDDLISRQAAIDEIRTMQTYKLFAGDDMLLVDQAEAMTNLMMMPTAEPRKGKWLSVFVDGLGFNGLMFECSECGKRSAGRTNFCAYCGADMRGERNEP